MTRENKKVLIAFRDTQENKRKIVKKADNNCMNLSEFVRYCVYKEMKGE